MVRFAIVDCGIGNLRSVQKIFERLETEAIITDEPNEVAACDGIVLPGVGAFGDAMAKLEDDGTAAVIRQLSGKFGKPLLGICLGMQLLGRTSTESPGVKGLDLVPGETVSIDIQNKRDWMERKLTLPHIGWNSVSATNRSQLFDGLKNETDFYFVHGLQFKLNDPTWIGATVSYGSEIVCAIDHGNICATQFHPEKSQWQGQRLIKNFISRTVQTNLEN